MKDKLGWTVPGEAFEDGGSLSDWTKNGVRLSLHESPDSAWARFRGTGLHESETVEWERSLFRIPSLRLIRVG